VCGPEAKAHYEHKMQACQVSKVILVIKSTLEINIVPNNIIIWNEIAEVTCFMGVQPVTRQVVWRRQRPQW